MEGIENIIPSAHHEVGLITAILCLLVLSRLFGELMAKFKQSPVVGEIMAGIVLGPAVLGFVEPSPELAGISELSVFLILLAAGLEMNFVELMRALVGSGAVLGAVSFVIPMGLGVALSVAFGMGALQSVLIALVIAITALPVIARIMSQFNLLNSDLAQKVIATAMFNDIAALFFLGVVLGLPGSDIDFSQLMSTVGTAGGKLLLFAAAVGLIGVIFQFAGGKRGYIEKYLNQFIQWFGKESLFGITILFVLIIGSISELLSSHFVIGVFFGGLLISSEAVGKQNFESIEETLNSITTGFLAPIFFAFIGLRFNWEPLVSPKAIIFAVFLILVSFLSKLTASRLAGGWLKMSAVQSIGLGILLNSRGTMDLVVADIALRQGLIDDEIFSTLVLLGVVSTILTPILFKWKILKHMKQDEEIKESHAAEKTKQENTVKAIAE